MTKNIISGIILVLCIVGAGNSYAKDYGRHGSVFHIEETPLFEMIRNRLSNLQEAGEFDKLNEQLKRNVIAGVEKPDAVGGLQDATEHKTYMFDPSITITEDIEDNFGNLIASAGTKVNPLEHVSMQESLLFIRGDKTEHLSLIDKLLEEKKGKIKIIFVSGKPLEQMREKGVRIYFDQGGALVNRFDITTVPAIVEQEGMLLKITEVPL